MRLRALSIFAALNLVACIDQEPQDERPFVGDDDDDDDDDGDDDDDDDDDGDDDDDDDATPDADRSLHASHMLGSTLQAEAADSATLTTEAVWLASQSVGTGAVVTTGTLTQSGQSVSYAAQPNDRLVVELGDGNMVDIWVLAMDGDFSGSASNFRESNHDLQYRVAVADRIDMTFTSQRNGGNSASAAEGNVVLEGVTYDCNVQGTGTYYFEADTTGVHFLDDAQVQGRITGAGFDLDVDETWHFELVSTNDGSAQDARRTIDNSLDLGGTVFDFVDIEMQKAFKDGSPTEIDTYWNAQGTVLRNGSAYGQMRLDVDVARVRFVLDTPGGTVELESHLTG